MSAAITSTAASAPFFYLFKSPLLLFPSYEIGRILFNTIWKTVYRKSVESEFSERALLAGVHKGVFNCANAIRHQNKEQLSAIISKESLDRIIRRLNDFPQEVLDRELDFKETDIRSSFIHSYTMSTDRAFGMTEEFRPTYYATGVAFIDRPNHKSYGTDWEKRNIDDMLVCNITFGRVVSPLGRWRITDVNYFEGKAIRHFR